MTSLVLVDIDGTLVKSGDLHTVVYQYLYKAKLGRDVSFEMMRNCLGQPLTGSLEDVLSRLGIPITPELIADLRDSYGPKLEETLSTRSLVPLEGVVPFLSTLQSRGHYRGIVTGNVESSAELILKKIGVRDYFQLMACDHGFSQRADIVKHAIDVAVKKNYCFEKVFVVGDTVNDVIAGKAVGAFTVAVATGANTKEQLAAVAPDLLLGSLEEYNRIIEQLR